MLVLKNYNSDPYFTKLNASLEDMKNQFNEVKITYEMGEPEAVEKDGMLTIVQNEKSVVHISKEQLKAIIAKTEKVRNILISL